MQPCIERSVIREWDDIRFFLEVARHGSFSKAAAALRTSQTTVGRHIYALEETLQTKLFHRLAKGVQLTKEGEEIRDYAEHMEQAAFALERKAHGIENRLNGDVRLALTDGMGAYWVSPRLLAFHRRHPEITVELMCSTVTPNVAKLAADVAISYERPDQIDLVFKKLGQLAFAPFASFEYISAEGAPGSVEDIYQHRLCDHTEYPEHAGWTIWREISQRHRKIVYRTNSSMAMLEATRAGLGISLLPSYIASTEPKLKMLDVPSLNSYLDFFIVFHPDMRRIPRVRALIDFLCRSFQQEASSLDPRKAQAESVPAAD